MNRPCFSLGVLLSSLAVCLLAVGSANSQTGLDLHSPPCLMCPYSGHLYADPMHAALAEQIDHPAEAAELPVAEPAAVTPDAAPAADTQVEVDEADYDLDYDAEYDYSDYDDSDYDDSDYDDSDYDDSDYDYYDYENDYDYVDSDADTDAGTDDSTTDDSDYTEADDDYSNYDIEDYERWYAEGTLAAPAPGVEAPASDPAPADASEFDEFDNYDYEDYFAEVYGTVEDAVDAEDAAAIDAAPAEIPATDTPAVSHEDVEPFDDFDIDAWEPVATEDEPVCDHADSDAAIYDLRTRYDDTYDEVMAPAVEAPTVDATTVEAAAIEAPAIEDQDFSGTDHCFGGYADAYRSEYRCDLADAYRDEASQSFYHDAPDPSATQIAPECVVEPASEASADEAAPVSDAAAKTALSVAVEPYVALVMDRVGTAWQQLSLDAIVAKAVVEVAKLPEFVSQGAAKAPVAASMADYIDCHVDAADCQSHCCEIDCFAPWEPSQPVGSGVEQLQEAASEQADPQAEMIDTEELEFTKALIRDLRTRMNAARQSPPLR